jgi:ubiquinone/menaquinone biosynthesis C-methylase UbiE
MNAARQLYFNLIAPGYSLCRRPGWEEREMVRRLLSPPPDGRLLDLGSGPGHHARDLLRRCPALQVTAVEPAWLFRVLSRAAAWAGGLSGRLDHSPASAERLPFPDASFAGALCLFVLWAVKERSQVLAELARVIRPGGTLVLGEFVQPVRLPFGHPPWAGAAELAAFIAPHFAVAETVQQAGALFVACRTVRPGWPGGPPPMARS